MTKTIIFFIPQQSEIHLTTRYKVTHRTKRQCTDCCAILAFYCIFTNNVHARTYSMNLIVNKIIIRLALLLLHCYEFDLH